MISWIIIIALIVLGVLAIKANHLRHRFFIVFFVIIALFIYSTFYLVSIKNNFDFSTSEGVFNAVGVYTAWLGNSFENLRVITGNAVKMDWTGGNMSKTDKKK